MGTICTDQKNIKAWHGAEDIQEMVVSKESESTCGREGLLKVHISKSF